MIFLYIFSRFRVFPQPPRDKHLIWPLVRSTYLGAGHGEPADGRAGAHLLRGEESAHDGRGPPRLCRPCVLYQDLYCSACVQKWTEVTFSAGYALKLDNSGKVISGEAFKEFIVPIVFNLLKRGESWDSFLDNARHHLRQVQERFKLKNGQNNNVNTNEIADGASTIKQPLGLTLGLGVGLGLGLGLGLGVKCITQTGSRVLALAPSSKHLGRFDFHFLVWGGRMVRLRSTHHTPLCHRLPPLPPPMIIGGSP